MFMRLGEQLITSKIEPYFIKPAEKKQEFFNNAENVKLTKKVGIVALAVVALFVAVNLHQANPVNPVNPNPVNPNPVNQANQWSCDSILINEDAFRFLISEDAVRFLISKDAVRQQIKDQLDCIGAVIIAIDKLIPIDFSYCHLALEQKLQVESPLWGLITQVQGQHIGSICSEFI